jgi:hypothetical protein
LPLESASENNRRIYRRYCPPASSSSIGFHIYRAIYRKTQHSHTCISQQHPSMKLFSTPSSVHGCTDFLANDLYCITCLMVYYRYITIILNCATRNTRFITIIYSDRMHYRAAFTIHSFIFICYIYIINNSSYYVCNNLFKATFITYSLIF